jgi:uncharacterized protein YndB with AHSA1/START domain
MRVQKSIAIEAPPERIWPYLVEPEKILEWYFPLQEFEYTSQQRGGVGAPLYFQEKTSGGTMKLNCVITEWVENETLAFKMTSGNMLKSYQERWSVEATPSGSRFTFGEQGEFPNWILDKVIGPLAQRSSESTVEKMLTRLKSLVES